MFIFRFLISIYYRTLVKTRLYLEFSPWQSCFSLLLLQFWVVKATKELEIMSLHLFYFKYIQVDTYTLYPKFWNFWFVKPICNIPPSNLVILQPQRLYACFSSFWSWGGKTWIRWIDLIWRNLSSWNVKSEDRGALTDTGDSRK